MDGQWYANEMLISANGKHMAVAALAGHELAQQTPYYSLLFLN